MTSPPGALCFGRCTPLATPFFPSLPSKSSPYRSKVTSGPAFPPLTHRISHTSADSSPPKKEKKNPWRLILAAGWAVSNTRNYGTLYTYRIYLYQAAPEFAANLSFWPDAALVMPTAKISHQPGTVPSHLPPPPHGRTPHDLLIPGT